MHLLNPKVTAQYPCLSRFKTVIVSILTCCFRRYLVKDRRFITGLQFPVFLGTRKRSIFWLSATNSIAFLEKIYFCFNFFSGFTNVCLTSKNRGFCMNSVCTHYLLLITSICLSLFPMKGENFTVDLQQVTLEVISYCLTSHWDLPPL